jgi:hypothetical protein
VLCFQVLIISWFCFAFRSLWSWSCSKVKNYFKFFWFWSSDGNLQIQHCLFLVSYNLINLLLPFSYCCKCSF